MSLDRSYFEALSLRDLRGLLDGAGVKLRERQWVIAFDRPEHAGIVTALYGIGPTLLDALLDGLGQASAAGWFDGEERR